MHQPPSLPLPFFLVSIDWSPILRANWESKMSAFSFQSNYQIHLNLIISQTLGWDLYIIRAICLSQTASFLTQLLWKKVPSLLNSLHTSPVHWVIKIVLSFAESLSCHLSRFFLLFQPCFHCCTNFTFHPLTTSCMNGLDLINVVFRQHVNCSVDLISAFFTELLNSEAGIVYK